MSSEIILHGGLRERFGESFKMQVRDPVEAYRALACQLQGFSDEIRSGEFNLIREMPNGTLAITEDMLFLGMDNCKLHFIPSVEGAGNKGAGKLILGIAMIGASLFIPGSAAFLGMSIQTMGIMTGAALALGGLALMLTPTPKLSTGEGDDKDSFLFNGNTNPSGQNFAVPLGFGRFRCPSYPVASVLITNQVSSGSTGLAPDSKLTAIVGATVKATSVFGD